MKKTNTLLNNPQSKNKTVLFTAATVLCVNLILFFTKLFIGLSANSISVYSDGINNLFDGISGILTVAFMYIGSGYSAKKVEQLLSFLISCFIGFSGAYFLYSSAERLMYPTPVWYTQKFFILLCVTTVTKLILFFILKKSLHKNSSPIIRLMSTDSLLDFFIGCTTLLTLLLSKNGKYAIDAVCGIIISAVILISAVKGIINAVKLLINHVSKEKREIIERIISSNNITEFISSIQFADNDICIVTAELPKASDAVLQEVCEQIKQQTGINTFINRKGN